MPARSALALLALLPQAVVAIQVLQQPEETEEDPFRDLEIYREEIPALVLPPESVQLPPEPVQVPQEHMREPVQLPPEPVQLPPEPVQVPQEHMREPVQDSLKRAQYTNAPTPPPTAPTLGGAETPESTAAPTLAPTLPPGVPCDCLQGACFDVYDRNSDGCISQAECDVQVRLMDNCSLVEWNPNQDDCIDRDEWSTIFSITNGTVCPVEVPDAAPVCNAGYYLTPNPLQCTECVGGETRRRRSFECTACPLGYFDAGNNDDCLSEENPLMATDIPANTTELPVTGADEIREGDIVVLRGPPPEPNCNVTETETCVQVVQRVTVVAKGIRPGGRGALVFIDPPTTTVFPRYTEVLIECTNTDGTDLSRRYMGANPPTCACGNVVCNNLQVCTVDTSGGNFTGECVRAGPYPVHHTPAPTVGAKGDPHLVNLQGEHFDINHDGEFTLLRFPQSKELPAELAIHATIQAEYGKPCTTYITAVEISGAWLGGASLQVRCYMKARHTFGLTEGAFLGVRMMRGGLELPWQPIEEFADELLLSEPGADYEVSLSKSQWFQKKRVAEGVPAVAGMFTLVLRNKGSQDGAKITLRQDLPDQEHLNMAIRRLSQLGRVDVGGLLGFDPHPDTLEMVTAACNHHRSVNKPRVESQEAPYYFRPAWKERWDKRKKERERKRKEETGNARDNEAAAEMIADVDDDARDLVSAADYDVDYSGSSSLSCMCPANGGFDGVLVEEPSFLWGSAHWD